MLHVASCKQGLTQSWVGGFHHIICELKQKEKKKHEHKTLVIE